MMSGLDAHGYVSAEFGADIMSPQGFIAAAQWPRRLGPRGGTVWAPQPETWSCFETPRTRRSKQDPLGDGTKPAVAAANVYVSRLALFLIMLHTARQQWCLWQPLESMLCLHPRIAELQRLCSAHWFHVKQPSHRPAGKASTQRFAEICAQKSCPPEAKIAHRVLFPPSDDLRAKSCFPFRATP